jgi:hypothetical protein
LGCNFSSLPVEFVSDFDLKNVVFWGSQLRAAHLAQQNLCLQAKDVASFFFGLKPKNLIDTGVFEVDIYQAMI